MIRIIQKKIFKIPIRYHHHLHLKEKKLVELYRQIGENYFRDSDINLINTFKEIKFLEDYIKNNEDYVKNNEEKVSEE